MNGVIDNWDGTRISAGRIFTIKIYHESAEVYMPVQYAENKMQSADDFLFQEDESGQNMTEPVSTPEVSEQKAVPLRWVYEQPMMKSFFLLFEVWKAMGLTGAILILFMIMINLFSGQGLSGIIGAVGIGLLVCGILLVLSLPAYWIVTKANNGMYTVLFEMDDEGVDHIQIKTEKAKALDILTIAAGIISKNRSVIGSGLISASGASLYSRFSDIRKIRVYPDKNLITLKGRFMTNQVYADDEEFGDILDFILDHCPDAEIG